MTLPCLPPCQETLSERAIDIMALLSSDFRAMFGKRQLELRMGVGNALNAVWSSSERRLPICSIPRKTDSILSSC